MSDGFDDVDTKLVMLGFPPLSEQFQGTYLMRGPILPIEQAALDQYGGMWHGWASKEAALQDALLWAETGSLKRSP